MLAAGQVRKIDRKWKLCHNPLHDPATGAYKRAEAGAALKLEAQRIEKVCRMKPDQVNPSASPLADVSNRYDCSLSGSSAQHSAVQECVRFSFASCIVEWVITKLE